MEDQILDAPLLEKPIQQYAGFWIRFAAYLIDYVVIMAIIFILSMILGVVFQDTDDALYFVFAIVVYGTYLFYFIIMESSAWQATLGKRAVGIKVGDRLGKQISFGHALGRFFAKLISGLPFTIGFMMAGWDSKKQALHDKIANTYVFYY